MSDARTEIEALRGMLASIGADQVPLSVLRQGFDAQHASIPLPDGCTVEPLSLGGIPCERLTPSGPMKPGVLFYIHGGGFSFGSCVSHRHLVARLAHAAGLPAVTVGYRLAPEAPFPAGLEDAFAAFRGLAAVGYDPGRVIVGGESAGGNLAAALLLLLKSRSAPPPLGLYLLSGWLDLRHIGPSFASNAANDPLVSVPSSERLALQYLGGHRRDDPLASPVLGDLAGFPPIFLQVAGAEALLSDSLLFAERAALAGCAVRLSVWPEMVHAWPLFHPMLKAGLDGIEEPAAWMRARLGG